MREGGTISNLSHLFVGSKVFSDEPVGVVVRGQIDCEAIAVAGVLLVATSSFHDVSVNVEISEER